MRKASRVSLILGLLLAGACANNRAVKALDPDSREFLSTVRYLISKEERQAFLAVPDEAGRKLWMEDFWKKRDQKPETPENEFKTEYLRRIEDANRLFKEGSTPGWLGERGHLYVNLGPPDTRETYPRGVSFYGVPTEVWYYNFFPIVFIDDGWTGNYRLVPESAAQVGELNRAQVMFGPAKFGSDAAAAASLDLSVSKVKDGEALVRLRLPYRDIWFKAEGDRFQATLELEAEVSDAAGKTVWQDKKSYPLAFGRAEYLEAIRQDFLAELPVSLAPGEYEIKVSLNNAAGEGRAAVKKEKFVL
jgi:GWxTD domain-containing protein